MKYISYYKSRIGQIILESDGENLTGLYFQEDNYKKDDYIEKELLIFKETKKWLDLYFNGENPKFIPKIILNGSDFQKQVLNILMKIPYGKTTTYGNIASIIKKENNLKNMSAQAVGNAISNNPICIIIPCHRVIARNNKIGGYHYGIKIKKELLKLEKYDINSLKE